MTYDAEMLEAMREVDAMLPDSPPITPRYSPDQKEFERLNRHAGHCGFTYDHRARFWRSARGDVALEAAMSRGVSAFAVPTISVATSRGSATRG